MSPDSRRRTRALGCLTSAKPSAEPTSTAISADQNAAMKLVSTARRSETLFQAAAYQSSVQPVNSAVCLPSEPTLKE